MAVFPKDLWQRVTAEWEKQSRDALAKELSARLDRDMADAMLYGTGATVSVGGGGGGGGSGTLTYESIKQMAKKPAPKVFAMDDIVPQRGAVWAMVGDTMQTNGMPDYVIDFFDMVGARFPWTSIEVKSDDKRWVMIFKYELFDIPLEVGRNYDRQQLTEDIANKVGDAIVAEIGDQKKMAETGATAEELRQQREREAAIEDFGRDIDLGLDVKRN